MKIFEDFIDSVCEFVEDFGEQNLKISIGATFGVLLILAAGYTYYLSSSTTSLIKKLTTLDDYAKKLSETKNLESFIMAREVIEREMLNKNKLPDGIKPFLEKKITEQNLTAENGWKENSKTNPWAIDPDFNEEKLTLNFKKISTQQLTLFLEQLTNQPAIAIRELEIKLVQDGLSVQMKLSYRFAKT